MPLRKLRTPVRRRKELVIFLWSSPRFSPVLEEHTVRRTLNVTANEKGRCIALRRATSTLGTGVTLTARLSVLRILHRNSTRRAKNRRKKTTLETEIQEWGFPLLKSFMDYLPFVEFRQVGEKLPSPVRKQTHVAVLHPLQKFLEIQKLPFRRQE